MEKVKVVCLKWGNKYGPVYVNRLLASVKRNTSVPFEFHCFTDNHAGIKKGVEIHKLAYADKLTGWWNKLFLFSEKMPLTGKIFFIDLDTVITGNLDDLMGADGFIVLRDFFAHMARGVSNNHMGSGLMSWNTDMKDDYKIIWDKFIKNPKQVVNSLHPHGDQRWIQKFTPYRLYWQDLFPGQVVSFKTHCAKGLPADARVVCYHGKPSVPESLAKSSKGWRGATIPPAKWVGVHWRE